MIKYLEKEEDFKKMIDGKCLIDFYANWCGPCKMLGQVLEENVSELKIDVLKIDTDKFPNIAREYGVMSIPTVILMENGLEKNKHIGFMGIDEIKDFIK